MTLLKDHQFEILPSESATDGFVFGIGAEVSITDAGFDPGENTWLTQDAQNTRRGVNALGRDVLGGKTWTWASHVNRSSEEQALDTLDRFSAAWMPDEARLPGWTTGLRYNIGGRVRRVFGRPRRFAAPPDNLILGGYAPIDHDFQTVDAFTYDDVESQAQVLFSSIATGGGFVFPAVAPVITQPNTGNGSGQVVVGGRARAYPIIRFNGPWTNPILDTGSWSLRWNGEIPPLGWVEIDCRPWVLTVKNHAGASVVGGLERRTWLEDCWFAPQSRPQVALGGIATGGSASALLRWRNTWTSM